MGYVTVHGLAYHVPTEVRIEMQRLQELEASLEAECTNSVGEPIRCRKCRSTEFTDKVTYAVDGIPCEFHRHCTKCDEYAGEFMYGQWTDQ